MRLIEVVRNLEKLDDELVIYVAANSEWNAFVEANLYLEPKDGSLPSNVERMEYFLEVEVAKEVLEVWKKWRDNREPTLEEKCDAIIYYASYDAFIPSIGWPD